MPNKLPKKQKINPRKIQEDYVSRIENSLQKDGVALFDEKYLDINEEYLRLPREITEVTSKELGEYLNAFTQQKMYLRTVAGRVLLYIEECRRKYYEVSAEKYRRLSTDKMSETAKERIILSSPEVRPTYEEYMDFKNKGKILENTIANIEDTIFLLSREISRRTGDFAEDRREYNVSRR